MDWKTILYGSDYDIVDGQGLPKEFITFSDLTQPDLEYATIKVLGNYPRPSLESNTTTFLNDYQEVTNVWRNKYTIKYYPKSFPDTLTGTEEFYDTDVLIKKYHWVYFQGGTEQFPLVPDGFTDVLNAGQKVNITGYGDVEEDGKKSMVIHLTAAYPITNG